MSEMNRVQRWRQQQHEAGKDALTIWLPRELKLYVEDMALKRHCSPSDLIQQALTTCYPLSADVTDTVTDTSVTDTSQIRLMLQQELRAFFGERLFFQGGETVQPVTDTVTDTSVQAEAERVAIRALQGVTDTVTDTSTKPALDVTDTVTDTESVTDTVTVTGHTMEPFDTTKYVLGKLCPRGHAWGHTGKSLLRRTNRHCVACDREKFHERKQAKRQEVSA